ncbi:MAG: hypothetical protein KJN80_02865 [Deltaproteobacteria bacterium]|nr:hypothetical protein [Deltaproteobacteria bacterium]
MKNCPKCGFEDYQEGPECPQCGIIYEKYYNLMGIKEVEDEDLDSQEEDEQSEEHEEEEKEQPEEMPYVEQQTPIEKVTDLVKKNYLFILGGVFLFIVVISIIYCVGSRTVGKTGVVSWYNILGEEAQSGLLFDNIDLLKTPDSQEGQIVCVMQSGTKVKVLKDVNLTYKIKVLEGVCKGEVGFVIKEHFEEL